MAREGRVDRGRAGGRGETDQKTLSLCKTFKEIMKISKKKKFWKPSDFYPADYESLLNTEKTN